MQISIVFQRSLSLALWKLLPAVWKLRVKDFCMNNILAIFQLAHLMGISLFEGTVKVHKNFKYYQHEKLFWLDDWTNLEQSKVIDTRVSVKYSLRVFKALRGIETCCPLTPLNRASPEDSGSENSRSDSRCSEGHCTLRGGVSTVCTMLSKY